MPESTGSGSQAGDEVDNQELQSTGPQFQQEEINYYDGDRECDSSEDRTRVTDQESGEHDDERSRTSSHGGAMDEMFSGVGRTEQEEPSESRRQGDQVVLHQMPLNPDEKSFDRPHQRSGSDPMGDGSHHDAEAPSESPYHRHESFGPADEKTLQGTRMIQSEQSQTMDDNEGADLIPGVDDLPIFANEQSKALNDEIKRLERLVTKADSTLVENRERIEVMEEHLKNVRQEVGHTNALIAAKKKEMATEEHLCALAARESGRYTNEARRFVLEAEESQEKLNAVQNAIFRGNESMDRFKLQMNWNQEELEQWALAAKQKEEDNLALQKYTRADDAKIKELSLQVERLSKSAVSKWAGLQNLEADSAAKQVELDSTAEEFRRLHEERQDLVRQWQSTIDNIRRRDAEINAAGEKYAAARQVRAERAEVVEQNAARLKKQESENEEVQGSIESLERMAQRRRQESQDAQRHLEDFRDVLEVAKNTLGNSAGALARKRAENVNLTAQIDEKRVKLETARRKYQASKHRARLEVGNTLKAEATAKSAEEELQQREAELRSAKKSLAGVKEGMFRDSQRLFAFRQEEANLIADICGAQATMKNLQTKIHSLDHEQTRQQELIYSAEFQIQQMERKVARGLGERTDDEKKALTTKIRELEVRLGGLRDEKKMLTGQARKLNNELRASLRRHDATKQQQGELKEAINELELECRAAESEVKRESQSKEELMVSNDVMRLEVKRLRDVLNGAADDMFSLENRRQQLTMSMTERKAEIKVHWELQRATLRAAEEERHRIQLELGERRHTTEKLRVKYETLAKGFAGAGIVDVADRVGEGGSSQAYYIIVAAQRREELQREGDGLDQDIRKCEREIRALDSTLQHLNARNVDFRVSFQRADPNSRDADALRSLESRVKAAQDTLFNRKKELQRVQTDHEQDVARLEDVRTHGARVQEQLAELESARNKVQGELDAQREALSKADARLARNRERHRLSIKSAHSSGEGYDHAASLGLTPASESTTKTLGIHGETLTEKALRAGAMRDAASGILYTLGQLVREFPEIRDALNARLKKHRLRVPATPPMHGPARVRVSGGRTGYSSSGSEAGDSRPGSEHSSQSGGSVSNAASGERCWRRSAGSNSSRGGSVGGSGSGNGSGSGFSSTLISPMRVFEAPM